MTSSSSRPSDGSAVSDQADLSTTMTPMSLASAVFARRGDYVRPRKLRLKIGTWNVAACPGTDRDLASWFVGGRGIDETLAALDLSHNPAVAHQEADSHSVHLLGGDDIGLYVLGLQEVVDLNVTKEYVNRTVYTESSPQARWRAALEAAMPPGYELIVAEQMTGLLLFIYASPEVAASIDNVSTKQVGTGLLGYFGNKGAITSRLVLGEATRLVFVNCHLASGASSSYLDRRCWDVGQILSRTHFDPVVHAGVAQDEGSRIGDEDFAFWFGDLNFRLEGLPGHDIRRILTLHARGEYGLTGDNSSRPPPPLDGTDAIVVPRSESEDGDVDLEDDMIALQPPPPQSHQKNDDASESSLPDPDEFPQDPSQDPTSLQATLDSLLPHDQLRRVMAGSKAFHDGWREGPICFLPSYKYDVGTVGLFDSSEKQRSPSWCDRILYRTGTDKQQYYQRLAEEMESKRKDEEMKSRGIDRDDDVLFCYDPDADGDDDEMLKDKAGIDYDEYDEAADEHESGEAPSPAEAEERIQLEIYTSHQRITSSDHKPVTSIFTIDYDAVVPEMKAKVYAEAARELDRAENEGRPAVTIVVEDDKERGDGEVGAIDFGELGFLEKKSRTVTIANTGGVPASFGFLEKPSEVEDDKAGGPPWLTTAFLRSEEDDDGVRPTPDGRVTLEPGATVLANVEAQVSEPQALAALNEGQSRLEEVLVLAVDKGRDHFIPVRASWLPTCLGRSVDELIRVPKGGIRNFVRQRGIQGAVPYNLDVQCSTPKELVKLTEAVQTLAERCVAEEAMLEDVILPRDLGWPLDASTRARSGAEPADSAEADIITALDTDGSIMDALPMELPSSRKLELVSAVLLLFLGSLTDGLVPPQLCAKLFASLPSGLSSLPAAAWADVKAHVLDVLSAAPNHSIAFVFLSAAMARVAGELTPASTDRRRGGLARRRLSFLREGDAREERSRRQRAREGRYGEILGPLVFRAREKDKWMKEKERIVLQMFLGREPVG